MRRIISFNKTIEKLLLSGKQRAVCIPRPLRRAYKEALRKAGVPLDEKPLFIFHFGFMLEDNSYQMMESLPLAEVRCHHDNRYSRC